MTATRITAERIAEYRAFPFTDWATIRELLIALESAYAELDRLSAQGVEVPELRERLAEWEEFRSQFSDLSYHHSGMGCGIEDRGITDRYKACEHGWEEAMERVAERMPEEREEIRPAPPHPDTVVVSREEWKILERIIETSRMCANWSDRCANTDLHNEDLKALDALRAQAQPATEREGT